MPPAGAAMAAWLAGPLDDLFDPLVDLLLPSGRGTPCWRWLHPQAATCGPLKPQSADPGDTLGGSAPAVLPLSWDVGTPPPLQPASALGAGPERPPRQDGGSLEPGREASPSPGAAPESEQEAANSPAPGPILSMQLRPRTRSLGRQQSSVRPAASPAGRAGRAALTWEPPAGAAAVRGECAAQARAGAAPGDAGRAQWRSDRQAPVRPVGTERRRGRLVGAGAAADGAARLQHSQQREWSPHLHGWEGALSYSPAATLVRPAQVVQHSRKTAQLRPRSSNVTCNLRSSMARCTGCKCLGAPTVRTGPQPCTPAG